MTILNSALSVLKSYKDVSRRSCEKKKENVFTNGNTSKVDGSGLFGASFGDYKNPYKNKYKL